MHRFFLIKLIVALAMTPAVTIAGDALQSAVAGEHRTAAFVERDVFRHPAETMAFFELAPDQSIVEIWPGGGWYTEVLAPVVAEEGILYVAAFSDTADDQPAYRARLNKELRERLAAHPEVYSNVEWRSFLPPSETDIAPPNSVDRVVTFRNAHNFVMGGTAEAAFAAFYKALKPGGLLGVVDHRAPAGADMDFMRTSGYLTEALVRQLAADAGFEFVASSEINANPKDTADHPRGVWTLPPTLRLGDTDKDKYLAIGESDRMTLKFRKPE